jgi:hypothetical protein
MRSIRISTEFDPYIRVHILGGSFNISRFSSHSHRVFQKMCKFIQMTGDALYDWETRSTKIPAGASISMHGLTSDMSQWSPYHGEIPEEAGVAPYQILVTRYMAWSDEEIGKVPVIPGLRLLCERY